MVTKLEHGMDSDGHDDAKELSSADTEDEGGEEGDDSRLTYTQIINKKIQTLQAESDDLVSRNQPLLAIKRLDKALAMQTRNPQLFEQRGEIYYKIGNFDSAIVNINKALSLSGRDRAPLIQTRLATICGSYGEMFYSKKNYTASLAQFKSASLLYPEAKTYRIRCISCLLHLERYKDCLHELNEEIEAAGNVTVDLLHIRAHIYLLFDKVTHCYHDVETALNMDPDNEEILLLKQQLKQKTLAATEKANDYVLLGKKREALRKINVAIASDPYTAEHHIFRGTLYRMLGSFSAAVDDFLIAMDKCSHCYESAAYRESSRQLILTYNDFAVECFKKKCFNEAVTLLNKAIKQEKNERGLYINRGDCFFKLNEFHFALEDYEQAHDMSCEKQDSGLHYRLAVVHYTIGTKEFEQKNFTKSKEHFSRAISYCPNTARFYICLARTHYERKDYQLARDDTLRALRLNSSNGEYLPLVARLFPGKSIQELLKMSVEIDHPAETITYCTMKPSNQLKKQEETNPHLLELMAELSVSRCDSQHSLELSSHSKASEQQSQVEADEEVVEAVLPRPWSVLQGPLPQTLTTRGVPSLRHCMAEDDFHCLIYYAKRSCTDEVNQLIASPLHFPSQLHLVPMATVSRQDQKTYNIA